MRLTSRRRRKFVPFGIGEDRPFPDVCDERCAVFENLTDVTEDIDVDALLDRLGFGPSQRAGAVIPVIRSDERDAALARAADPLPPNGLLGLEITNRPSSSGL